MAIVTRQCFCRCVILSSSKPQIIEIKEVNLVFQVAMRIWKWLQLLVQISTEWWPWGSIPDPVLHMHVVEVEIFRLGLGYSPAKWKLTISPQLNETSCRFNHFGIVIDQHSICVQEPCNFGKLAVGRDCFLINSSCDHPNELLLPGPGISKWWRFNYLPLEFTWPSLQQSTSHPMLMIILHTINYGPLHLALKWSTARPCSS